MDGLQLADIVFYNGQLNGITTFTQLVKFEIGMNKDGGLVVTSEPHQPEIRAHDGPLVYHEYIVELLGKLVMVARIWSSHINHEPFLKMFELANESMTEDTHKWKELRSLGDSALLLGRSWSKAVYVPASGRGVVQVVASPTLRSLDVIETLCSLGCPHLMLAAPRLAHLRLEINYNGEGCYYATAADGATAAPKGSLTEASIRLTGMSGDWQGNLRSRRKRKIEFLQLPRHEAEPVCRGGAVGKQNVAVGHPHVRVGRRRPRLSEAKRRVR